MDDLVQAIQTSNEIMLYRGVTRIEGDHHGMKSFLAASNDDCWLTKTRLKILKVKMKNGWKWQFIIRKRKYVHAIKGKEYKSNICKTKVEAESLLCSARFGVESKIVKNMLQRKQRSQC